MTDPQKAAARARSERLATEKDREHAAQVKADVARRGAVPLYMSAFAEELGRQLPEDAVIFDESLTHSPELTRYILPAAPGRLFQSPGGTLGVGLPGAIGVKLAWPERPVIGLVGDGGALYTYQALWTAAHHRIDAKFVVCNNQSYRLLKDNLVAYWRERGISPPTFPPCFDISDPNLDFVSLAKGLGVPGSRVVQPGEMAPAIHDMLTHDGPFLIELMLEGNVHQ